MSDNAYAVVIPAYNAARTLDEAIQSVLAQTVAASDILVIDDGSTDDTADIAARYGGTVRVIRQVNAGVAAATTVGFRNVSAPFVAGLDADDIWLPEKAQRQLERFAREPYVDGLFCCLRNFHHGGDDQSSGAVSDGLSRSTMMLRASAVEAIGPVNDPGGARGRGEMIDWLQRGREFGLVFETLPEVLALRRILPGSLSYGYDPMGDVGYLNVVRASLERRRARSK
jgi:glycosyltransferase involved in cell wall biosynthesis